MLIPYLGLYMGSTGELMGVRGILLVEFFLEF